MTDDERAEAVARHRPIPVPKPDGRQCLRYAMAAILRQRVDEVPPVCEPQPPIDWIHQVEERFHVKVNLWHPPDGPQPRGPWIALYEYADGARHAEPVIGHQPAAYAGLTVEPA